MGIRRRNAYCNAVLHTEYRVRSTEGRTWQNILRGRSPGEGLKGAFPYRKSLVGGPPLALLSAITEYGVLLFTYVVNYE